MAVLEAVLASGCELDAAEDSGLTALHIAAAAGHSDCFLALRAAGADTNRRAGPSRWTPSCFAAAVAKVDPTFEGVARLI